MSLLQLIPESWMQEIRIGHACLLLVLAAVGCGGGNATADYVPSANQARQAVEQMLEAWHAGSTDKTEFRLPGSGPAVQIFDTQRATGKRLEKFQVVRNVPEKPNEPQQIEVKLKFDGVEAEVETTYFVVGIDPLLVFRDADYRQASGMN